MATIPCIAIGSFGGPGGNPWDDRTYNTIRQMNIYHGDVVNSVQIEYDENGESIWSPVRGGRTNTKAEVKLDYPNEFLISISGYTAEYASNVVVRSLTITSNKKQYGPYGIERGKYFSTTSKGGKIVGFYGRNGMTLDSIGAYFLPLPNETISIGPFGGPGGNPWDDRTYNAIRQMIIYHGDVVNSVQIEYDENGESKWSPVRGGRTNTKDEVKLDYPNEFIISISGYTAEYASNVVVRSLTITSNKKQYGPYGIERGEHFSTTSKGGKIVGFYGRNGMTLDSIGAYFLPLPLPVPIGTISIGPFGGPGGNPWDDRTYNTVRQMNIYHGDVVNSVQIEYDDNGESKWSPVRGGRTNKKDEVKLDYPNEFLISISGYTAEYASNVVVRSLTITSNKKQYGPYGMERGEYFSTTSKGGKIVGFYGRNGMTLDSIGAYFLPLPK